MNRLVGARSIRWTVGHTQPVHRVQIDQNNQVRNCAAKSASPPPNTITEICRLAPAPIIDMGPPSTMATSASDRAKGPVNVVARLFAAHSRRGLGGRGDWTDQQQGDQQNTDRAAFRATTPPQRPPQRRHTSSMAARSYVCDMQERLQGRHHLMSAVSHCERLHARCEEQ